MPCGKNLRVLPVGSETTPDSPDSDSTFNVVESMCELSTGQGMSV